jgi:hypothetical protein
MFGISTFCDHVFEYCCYNLWDNSNKSGWYYVAGVGAPQCTPPTPSPAIAELLSPESSSVFRWVRRTLLQSFTMFQASQMCLHFVKNKLSCCFTFWGYFIFLLLVFRELLEPNRSFTMNIDSEVCDGITGPNQSWTLTLYFNSYNTTVTSAIPKITFLRSLKFSQWEKMQIASSFVTILCSLVHSYQHFRGTCHGKTICEHLLYPKDWTRRFCWIGSNHLQNSTFFINYSFFFKWGWIHLKNAEKMASELLWSTYVIHCMVNSPTLWTALYNTAYKWILYKSVCKFYEMAPH